jgi:hypothetical protein
MYELNSILNEGHGDKRHQENVIDELMDILDDLFLTLESEVVATFKHQDVTFLDKLPIAGTMFQGVNHPKVRKKISAMIKKEWGKDYGQV